MEQTWRWFGPEDRISLTKIRQAGATGIVTALYHVPVGQEWSAAEVRALSQQIADAGLRWSVAESLPVHSAIRKAEPGRERYVDAYKASVRALGAAGVRTVCYNFMPIIDWTRTQLDWTAPDGSSSLRFDATEWAVFDVHLLARPGAESEYSEPLLARAQTRFTQMDAADKERLVRTVAAGLPGANERGHDLHSLRAALAEWQGVSAEQLRENLHAFLREVMPVCEQAGVRLCIHPDDPPRPLLGLPRIASSEADFERLFAAVPSQANGLTLCVGSLGAGRSNDTGRLARTFASRVHFAHLRSVSVEDDGSFVEAEHLQGDVDLIDIARVLVAEERARRADPARAALPPIAMRPDHGRTLDGDIADRPGYSWIGRLKALAELRGVLAAVERLT